MENLTYVTSNYGKYIQVKKQFEQNKLDIYYFKYDLDEPNINDIKFISKQKAIQAYNLLKSPVFVADSGFYIKNYPNNPNYPGAFVKRSQVSNDIENLLEEMKEVNDRECYFLDCLTYYDGNKLQQFFGKSEGTLAYQKKGDSNDKAKSNLWYVFIPKNCSKTLAQMTDYERDNRKDDRTSATLEFINWYKKEKINYKDIKMKTLT